jgi:hypothetical protein
VGAVLALQYCTATLPHEHASLLSVMVLEAHHTRSREWHPVLLHLCTLRVEISSCVLPQILAERGIHVCPDILVAGGRCWQRQSHAPRASVCSTTVSRSPKTTTALVNDESPFLLFCMTKVACLPASWSGPRVSERRGAVYPAGPQALAAKASMYAGSGRDMQDWPCTVCCSGMGAAPFGIAHKRHRHVVYISCFAATFACKQ